MKSKIWEYLTLSAEEQQNLWNNCVFVFDTNVLLNLYRYTSTARDTLLNAFEFLQNRVWLPHQVAYEYAKNRADVIYEMVEKYRSLTVSQETFVKNCMSELRLKETDSAVMQLNEMLNDWIKNQQEKNLLVTQVSDDKILEKIITLFDGKVGAPLSEEEMENVCLEGKKRYEKQIPPGYCDSKKKKDGVENNIYGDLIIWKQILDYSAHNHKDIIYVTHDQKEDWWSRSKGRTAGPRAELRKEFAEKTGQKFYMYSMEAFLDHYSKSNGEQANQDVIDEVSFIEKETQARKKQRSQTLFRHMAVLEKNEAKTREQIHRRARAIGDILMKYDGRQMPPEVADQLRNTEQNMQLLKRQLAQIQGELATYRKLIAENGI